MYKPRRFFDAGAADGGGGTPPDDVIVPFADLMNYQDPAKVPQDTTTEETTEVSEGIDENGEPLPGYVKDEEGNVVKEEENSSEGEEDEADVNAFFERVQAITGLNVDVDYGGLDPLTPEGAAIRETAIRQQALDEFDRNLEDAYPEAYRYFLHLQQGGNPTDFFRENGIGIPSTADQITSSVNTQEALVQEDLMRRGVPETVAKATVEAYIKDNKLENEALRIFNNAQEDNKRAIEDMRRQAAEREAAIKIEEQNTFRNIGEAMQDLKFIIPDNKKQGFLDFVGQTLRSDDTGFYVVQPIGRNPNEMKSVLEALYFNYSKGDLKSLVERKAKTQTVQTLKYRVGQDKSKNNGATGRTNVDTNEVPLFQL